MHSLELIWIWMALEIIQTPNHDKMEPEDIGELNFRTLCARSFLQIDDDLLGHICTCRMHDLIHELARSITQHECYALSSGLEKLRDTVRHLIIFLDEINLNTLPKLKKVHSIYVDSIPNNDNVEDSFLSAFISRFRYLRVFDLRNLSFEVLPHSIGTLKHLRLLDLRYNIKIKKLPDSICKLQSLQSLELGECVELEELPRDIRNLASLRNLVLTTKQACLPENGVGALKSLQFLSISVCANLKSLPTDLIRCTTLRTLGIADCEQLDLASGPIVNEVAQLSLQTLIIVTLPETTALPQWLKGAADTLRHLVVEDCEKLAALPAWFSNLRSLQKLVIENCKTLSSLPEGMQHLTSLLELTIRNCERLNIESGCNEVVQLSLQTLVIYGLPQMKALPHWLQGAANTLKELEIWGCEKLVALPEWFSNLRSLQKLVIENCKTLSSLPEGMQHLTSLLELTIRNCERLNIESGCNEVVQLSLQTLVIYGLPQMKALPHWLQGAANTLKELEIWGCEKLVALPEWFSNLRSLQKLVIIGCETLSSLPEGMQHLTSLEELTIKVCNVELHKRCKPEIGVDWPKIAHVPNRSIDDSFDDDNSE